MNVLRTFGLLSCIVGIISVFSAWYNSSILGDIQGSSYGAGMTAGFLFLVSAVLYLINFGLKSKQIYY